MTFVTMAKSVYDRTLRKVPGVHPVVRTIAWYTVQTVVCFIERVTEFRLPPGDIAPWFKLPWVIGSHEREVVSLYRHILRPGMHVVDVGAHAGYHTLRLSRVVGPAGRVYAFEPTPETFFVLQENVRRKRLSNVVLENCAVADYDGELRLFVFSHSTGKWGASNSVVNYSREQSEITVPCVALDSYFARIGIMPDFVKIDIEGAEPIVLRGMRTILSQKENIAIVMELYPQLIQKLGLSPSEHLTTLCERGFRLFEIRRDGEIVPIMPWSIASFVNSITKLTNVLALRGKWPI